MSASVSPGPHFYRDENYGHTDQLIKPQLVLIHKEIKKQHSHCIQHVTA